MKYRKNTQNTMGRIIKKGLDYFNIDVNIMENDGVTHLVNTYKSTGFVLYVSLLCEIYRAGYYKKLSPVFLNRIARKLRMSNKRIMQMIQTMIDHELFDEQLFVKQHLLTNKQIQLQYFSIKMKRITVEALSEYEFVLIHENRRAEKAVSDEKNAVPYIKKRKEKESKEKNIEIQVEVEEEEAGAYAPQRADLPTHLIIYTL